MTPAEHRLLAEQLLDVTPGVPPELIWLPDLVRALAHAVLSLEKPT